MKMDHEEFRKYKSLTRAEQKEAKKYMKQGMSTSDAIWKADWIGRLMLKILLIVGIVAGAFFGIRAVVRFIIDLLQSDCQHLELDDELVILNKFEETAKGYCKRCGKEFILQSQGRITELVESTCQKGGHRTYVCYFDRLPGHEFTKTDYFPKAECRKGELVEAPCEATCEKEGHDGIYKCEWCEKLIVNKTYPKTGHSYESYGFVDSTCYSVGWTAIEKCTGCGDEIGVAEEIPLKPHTELESEFEATNDFSGFIGCKCSVCDAVLRIDEKTAPPHIAEFITYSLDEENGTATVTGINKSATEYTIPATIDGLLVTRIGDSAFAGVAELEKITVEASLSEVGSCAFMGCTSLKQINLPEGLTVIEDSAFKDCTSLEGIILPESIEVLGVSSFSGCTGLKAIEFPDGLKSIENFAFSGCSALRRIYIENATVKYRSFENCTNLRIIEFGLGATDIWSEAFYECKRVIFIKFSDNMVNASDHHTYDIQMYFGTAVKNEYRSVNRFDFVILVSAPYDFNIRKDYYGGVRADDVITEENGFYYKTDEDFKTLIGVDREESHIVLPKDIVIIYDQAFRNLDYIDSIVVPDTVLKIGGSYVSKSIKLYFEHTYMEYDQIDFIAPIGDKIRPYINSFLTTYKSIDYIYSSEEPEWEYLAWYYDGNNIVEW